MSRRKLKNISIKQFEKFLYLARCNYVHTKAGHVKYSRSDLRRPIIFQTHINPMPEFIVKNILRGMGYSKDDFFDILEGRKIVQIRGNGLSFVIRDVN